MLFRFVALAFEQVDVGGARAEKRDLFVIDQLPHGAYVRVAGVAVEKDDPRAHPEHGHEPVPHHPGGGRHVEDRVRPLQVGMDDKLLELVDQYPADALDHALGLPRRAGGKHDIDGMVEVYLLEVDLTFPGAHSQKRPVAFGAPYRSYVGGCADVGDDDDLFYGGHGVYDRPHIRKQGECLVLVRVPVDGEEHLRGYLAEPVDDRLHAQLRAARGPGGADARGGEHGDCRLRDVGHVADHPVVLRHPQLSQGARHPADRAIELIVGCLHGRPGLALEDEGRPVVPVPEQVFGEIEPRAGEPPGAGELLQVLHRLFRPLRCLDADEIPDAGPELLDIGDRPVIKLEIAGEMRLQPVVDEPDKPRHVGVPDLLCRRRPKRLLHVISSGALPPFSSAYDRKYFTFCQALFARPLKLSYTFRMRYSLVPRPIFAAWSSCTFQSTSG